MTVGPVGAGGQLRHPDGNDRQQQGGGIREHVGRFGIQGDRVGPQAAAGLDQREAEQQAQRQPQAPLARLVGAMDMSERVRVRVPVPVPVVMMMIVGMPFHRGLSYRKWSLPPL